MSWHLGPLLAFDTETSGVDTDNDRIVTACTAEIDGTGALAPRIRTWLINPGVDIPEAAAAIHGITTEHAREHGEGPAGAVEDVAAQLAYGWDQGAVLVGHNVSFDLSILDAELRRHHGYGLTVAGPVIDTLVLDKAVDRYRKGKRTLTATAEHYAVRLDGAHDASQDALAAARIAWAIASRHADIALMDVNELMDFQASQARDQAASLQEYLRRKDPAAVVDGAWPMRRAVPA